MEKVRVIVYGVGRVGRAAIMMMANRKWLEIAGAIDKDKNKVGKDVGEVAGLGRKLGVAISDDPQAVFQKARARVVLHTTSLLHPEETEAQIIQSLEAGLNVISTTDWRLIYPWGQNFDWGKRVDELAKRKGIVFLETGIIPGLESDLIPIVYSGACGSVKKVKVNIVATAYGFSPLLLAYLGIGISPEEFERGIADGTLHSGLVSRGIPQLYLIADALGWKLDEVTRTMEKVMTAKEKMVMPSGQVIAPGQVCGFRAVHCGLKGKEAAIAISIQYQISVEAEEEKYEVETFLEGEPNIQVVTKGLMSDVCTAARAVNQIPQVLATRPGLVTIRELPVAAALE